MGRSGVCVQTHCDQGASLRSKWSSPRSLECSFQRPIHIWVILKSRRIELLGHNMELRGPHEHLLASEHPTHKALACIANSASKGCTNSMSGLLKTAGEIVLLDKIAFPWHRSSPIWSHGRRLALSDTRPPAVNLTIMFVGY
jgi:hypothetical protein